MSKIPKSFNTKKHAGRKGDYKVDEAKYIGKIVDSEYKENKKKNGNYLRFDFKLQNKKVNGHKISVYLNLDNPSETAVELANNELGSICDAVGFTGELKDSKSLHGKLLILDVGIDGDKNRINSYEPMKKGSKVSGEKKEKKIKAKDVIELAEDFSPKKLKKLLKEYEIKSIKEIKSLDEDDLTGLYEDLTE